MKAPKKYKANESEEKWSKVWIDKQLFKYDPTISRENTFVVDTPPPTVSGNLHIGHVYSYTQTDILVRFNRMLGKNIFYPIGWDDNGLPTERRIQNLFGIKCNSEVAYDDNFSPEIVNLKKIKKLKEVSRRNFIEACEIQTKVDEIKYKELWQRLGLSIDWEQEYATVDLHSQKISQLSFLDLIKKDYVYNAKRPIMWDTEFQTSVAQADVIEKEVNGFYHDIRFTIENSDETFVISTTRPELLPACIAVVAHPDDERFSHLFGKFAISPLFDVKIPIMPATHADPEKGTGILMVCTFGDINDVDFWKKESLPLKQVISLGGTMNDVTFGEDVFETLNPNKANSFYSKVKGMFTKQARKKIVELLKEDGALVNDPRPTLQTVKYYEKGQFPLEFVPTYQWYIKLLEHKETLLEQGRKVNWKPENSFIKYEQWVEGLNQDWCISRQRFFGVPFPIWYEVDDLGIRQLDKPIFASIDMLPVDPKISCPKGYLEKDRNVPGGFVGDDSVMDTWATSSVSPQISSHWGLDDSRHNSLFPADLRPQAHEIIRTWAFYTITKSWMHEKKLPWKNIAISGWVVAENKEKMSKSKGNSKSSPEELIKTYSSDAIRYWAGKAKLGQDTVYSEKMFSIGHKLVTKIFNSSKFVYMQLEEARNNNISFNDSDISEAIDISFINKLNTVIEDATKSFKDYEYHHALNITETVFWEFCDYYIELVKTRSYNAKDYKGGKSSLATLKFGIESILKLLSPILPFVCEEVWSWEHDESIHLSNWPTPLLVSNSYKSDIFEATKVVLKAVRSQKSKDQKSMKWPVDIIEIKTTNDSYELLKLAKVDINNSCSIINEWTFLESGEETVVNVTLSETKE